jgi:hypothetical protein
MSKLAAVTTGLISFAGIFSWLISLSLKDGDFIFFRIAGYLLPGDEKPGSGAFRFPLGWLLILAVSVALGIGVAKVIMLYFQRRAS